MDRRRVLVLVAAPLVALAAIGITLCLTIGRGGIETHGPVVSNEKPWIPWGGYGYDAEIAGVLALADDGCLLLGESAVVWPSGTRWDADSSMLELPGDVTALLGDTISGAGRTYEGREQKGWASSEAGRATAGCRRPDTAAIVFNQDDLPTVEPGEIQD